MAPRGLAAAPRHPLQHDRLAGLLAELEKEKGPVPQEAMEEVRREWPAPGEAIKKPPTP